METESGNKINLIEKFRLQTICLGKKEVFINTVNVDGDGLEEDIVVNIIEETNNDNLLSPGPQAEDCLAPPQSRWSKPDPHLNSSRSVDLGEGALRDRPGEI